MFKKTLMISIIFLTACASDTPLLSESAKADYATGKRYVENEEYGKAAVFLEKFATQYPYSQYIASVELLRLKAAYLDGQYILSETLGLRFTDAHPQHEERVYAQYLVAMSYYKQSSSALRDQQFSHRSRDAFIALNQQFPDNSYQAEITKYLDIISKRIASHEMFIGKFYFDKQLYIAAINRLTMVKNTYLSSHEVAAESLYYLIASYTALNQDIYANESLALLHKNFPNSKWYSKAKALM